MLLCFNFVLLLVHSAAATPLARRWSDFAEKHSWAQIPKGWEFHSEPPSDYTFDLRIGLKQSRMEELIENLLEISDPNHSRYGQHLTKEETEQLVRPLPESIEAVEAWLGAHELTNDDIIHRTGGGDWVTVRVSVNQAERMLGTKYNVYHHPKSGEKVVRALVYSLPHPCALLVFLQPKIKLVDNSTFDVDPAAPSSCTSNVTPACLRDLYHTVDYVPSQMSKNGIGVAGYLDDFANRADLQTFFKNFRPDPVGFSFNTIRINGGGDDQSMPGLEANLDTQYTTSISFPTPATFYSTGGSPPFNPDSHTPNNTNEPYLDWLDVVLFLDPIPPVITTSYIDDEQTVPQDYAIRVCNLFAQLGSQGVTLFFASGDFGVGAGDCRTNDGTDQVIFQPSFPASCPFVTTVGGTTGFDPETAAVFSGGGFSRYFATPSYQSAAVSQFITGLGTTYNGLYNKTGRAYPDVSAQSNRFVITVGGRSLLVAGTSASSPTIAGVFALLNDFRLSQGKSTLGFINPLIYSTASSGFNDITAGLNPGCGTQGFSAGVGWDPVTGLGTPDFLKLQKLV